MSTSLGISALYPESIHSLQHLNKREKDQNYSFRAKLWDHICLSNLKCEGFFFVIAFNCIMSYHVIYFHCFSSFLVGDYHIIPLDFLTLHIQSDSFWHQIFFCHPYSDGIVRIYIPTLIPSCVC